MAIVLIGLFSVTFVNSCPAGELGVSADVTYVSQYMFRGYDILDDHPAVQPSITLDFWQTGFKFNIWGSYAFKSSLSYLDEIDLTLLYGRAFWEDESYALNTYCLGRYVDRAHWEWNPYGLPNEGADHMEIAGGLSLPKLLPIGPSSLVPSYYLGYKWPKHSGGPERGCFHIFGLAYDLPIPALIPTQGSQAISLTTDLTYNDGVFGSEPGWSHSTAGLSTSFRYGGFALTPGINYQWSFEDTVNDEDESWVDISLSYSF